MPVIDTRQQGYETMIIKLGRALAAASLIAIAAHGPAWADTKDYEFQLVSTDLKKGDAVIAVKLVHKPSGRAIPDAVIFAKRIDMGPDGMAEMQAKLDPVAGGDPGLYRFKTSLDMAGRWALTLGAKVQGETGTVQSKLIVNAK
jgi:YtkA-like protein